MLNSNYCQNCKKFTLIESENDTATCINCGKIFKTEYVRLASDTEKSINPSIEYYPYYSSFDEGLRRRNK